MKFPVLWLSFVNVWVGIAGPHQLNCNQNLTLLKQINCNKQTDKLNHCLLKSSCYVSREGVHARQKSLVFDSKPLTMSILLNVNIHACFFNIIYSKSKMLTVFMAAVRVEKVERAQVTGCPNASMLFLYFLFD